MGGYFWRRMTSCIVDVGRSQRAVGVAVRRRRRRRRREIEGVIIVDRACVTPAPGPSRSNPFFAGPLNTRPGRVSSLVDRQPEPGAVQDEKARGGTLRHLI